jgi:hypothetical protein
MAMAWVFSPGGCATIVNDPDVHLTASFADGSGGECNFHKKRGSWSSRIPASTVIIRRSDDFLIYGCATEDGRMASGHIQGEMECRNMAASVIFLDLGHRRDYR